MHNVAAPSFPQARDVRQLVDQAGGHEKAASNPTPSVRRLDTEPAFRKTLRRGDGSLDDLAAIASDLEASGGHQLHRGSSIAGQIPMSMSRRFVARVTSIHHEDGAERPGKPEGRGQSGDATPHHHHVVWVIDPLCLVHCLSLSRAHKHVERWE
jgi:hypothetical protein